MSDTLTLVALSASAAVLHVLVPDHEIPLAMIGRANNWGVKQMTFWTLIAAVIHLSVSIVIGFVAVGVSMALAQYVADVAHFISGGLLVAFGMGYALLAWKGKHMHSHGYSHAHEHGNSHSGGDDHPHSHEGDTYTHGSLIDAGSRRGAIRGGRASMIAGVVGMAPCFTLIPILVAAVPYGTETIIWVMLVYALATIGMMIITANVMLKAIAYAMRLARLEKYIELTADVVIFVVGVWMLAEDYLYALLGITH